ncbi:hypothetical protein ACFVH6_06965 [Spirillospora sp. NPDC127200]
MNERTGRGRGPARPVPSHTAAKAAAVEIKDLRLSYGADGVELLPEDSDLLGLLAHLRRFGGVDRAVHPADARRLADQEFANAAVILRYLGHQLLVEELRLIQQARQAGVSWTRVSHSLGYKTRRGGEGRAVSLEAAVKAVEDARALADKSAAVVPRPRDAAEVRRARRADLIVDDWQIRHVRSMVEVTQELIKFRDRLPHGEFTEEFLDDLAEAMESADESSKGRRRFVVWFRATAGDLLAAAEEQPPEPDVQALLDRTRQLWLRARQAEELAAG